MLNVEGYDIYFKHEPNKAGTFVMAGEGGQDIYTHYKGVTTCYIEKDRETVVVDFAYCSLEDTFNKVTGRKVSLARALDTYGFDKTFRTKVWSAYREASKK